MLTLTSFITSKQNVMKLLFLQHSSLVQAYRRLQAKTNQSFKHFASHEVFFFLKIQAINVGGESPLLKMKLNEYYFCNL